LRAGGETALRAPIRALWATFLVNGAVFGTLAARIPAIKDRLDLGSGALGIALLGVALGAVVAFPAAGRLIARVGSRPVTRLGLALDGAGLILLSLAGSLGWLVAAAVALGAANGMLDVAMNAHGVMLEHRRGRPIMSSLHAAYSLGGLAGAAVGGAVAAAGVDVRAHFATVGLLSAAGALTWGRRLLPGGIDRAAARPMLRRPPRRLVVLGVAAFCCLFAEGAAGDWSAVYLRDSLGTGAGLAAAGFAAFSLAMAGGRLVGDRLTERLGSVRLLTHGALLAGGGLGVALAIGRPAAGIAGFAALGAGLAGVVPTLFRAGGTTPGVPAGQGIAAVSSLGYLGFLVGPPAIGFAAAGVGLPAALGMVAVLAATIAALAGSAAPVGVAHPAPGRVEAARG
jgi:MFS family permease